MRALVEYQNYREFLADFYADQKGRKTGLTYAKFSALAGIKSPNLLKQVIDASRNLTPENAQRFARAVPLLGDEIDYFEALVSFNQAGRTSQRRFYEERLQRIRERTVQHAGELRMLTNEEHEVMSDWKYWALMTLTTVPGFEERGPWLSERMRHVISAQESERMLSVLVRHGLVARNEHGRLVQTKRQVQSRPEVGKSLSRAFYEGLFHRASLSLKLDEPDEREFG